MNMEERKLSEGRSERKQEREYLRLVSVEALSYSFNLLNSVGCCCMVVGHYQ